MVSRKGSFKRSALNRIGTKQCAQRPQEPLRRAAEASKAEARAVKAEAQLQAARKEIEALGPLGCDML